MQNNIFLTYNVLYYMNVYLYLYKYKIYIMYQKSLSGFGLVTIMKVNLLKLHYVKQNSRKKV